MSIITKGNISISSSALPSGASTSANQSTELQTLQNLTTLTSQLLDRLEYGNITDKSKTLKVQLNPDLTSTIAIAAAQTLATITSVTAVASLTNTARQGDLQVQRVNEAILDMAFMTGITNNIAFS